MQSCIRLISYEICHVLHRSYLHDSTVETPKPIVVEDRDVILKVTGSTVCGSDMHLLHGIIPCYFR